MSPRARRMPKRIVKTQKERSEETREKLLVSARNIFVRTGFEAACIDDIARKAGYTRGAFYFNFKSKDELFIAVLEREIMSAQQALRELGNQYQDPHERLPALNHLYTQLGSDRHFVMLVLEFKLYAIRHPRSHARMAEAFTRLRQSRENLLGKTLLDLGVSPPLRPEMLEMGFWALCSGLALESQFSGCLSPEENKSILAAFSQRVLGMEEIGRDKPRLTKRRRRSAPA